MITRKRQRRAHDGRDVGNSQIFPASSTTSGMAPNSSSNKQSDNGMLLVRKICPNHSTW
jgi:hypothetical protein